MVTRVGPQQPGRPEDKVRVVADKVVKKIQDFVTAFTQLNAGNLDTEAPAIAKEAVELLNLSEEAKRVT